MGELLDCCFTLLLLPLFPCTVGGGGGRHTWQTRRIPDVALVVDDDDDDDGRLCPLYESDALHGLPKDFLGGNAQHSVWKLDCAKCYSRRFKAAALFHVHVHNYMINRRGWVGAIQ